MQRLLVIAACTLYFVSATLGQSSSRPILRMVQVQYGEAVCTLVHEDGNYRVEKVFRAKTMVATGAMDTARLQELRQIFSDTNLRKVSQEDIHNPLLSDTFDQVQLGIWRDRRWQNLVFASRESRKPYRKSLDPLLKWFHEIQRLGSSPDPVDKPNNCMPDNEVVQSQKTQPAVAPPAIPHAAAFIFRYRSREFFRGQVSEACTIVLPDGTYQWQEGHQVLNGKRRDRIAAGQIDKEAIQELKELLNSPDLKNAVSIETETWGRPTQDTIGTSLWMERAQDIMGISLWIEREDRIQNLVFHNIFNTMGHPKEIAGMNNLGYGVTSQKVLEPLKHWMKQYTNKSAHGTKTDGVGNDCYPTKPAMASDKPAS